MNLKDWQRNVMKGAQIMDCRHVSIFKHEREDKQSVVSADIINKSQPDQDRAFAPAKKREQTTKQLIVPAGTFLKCVAQRNRAKYPVSLSLRFPNGGVSWSVGNRAELLSLSHSDEVKRANLIYMCHIHDIVYIDVCRNGRLTVDKNCLPGVRHLSILSEDEMSRLWDIKESA